MWRIWTSATIALQLATPIVGYGTTISIAISYCPVVYPSSSSSTSSSTISSASTTPSIAPGEPVVLAFTTNGNSEYVRADGTITNDSSQAADFSVDALGQLMSGTGYVSTSGDVAFQPFAVSSDTPGLKRASRIFTQFLVSLDRTLEWINDAFVGGRAIFCVSDSTMVVAFNGVTPPGCAAIQLGVVPAEDVNPSATSSTTDLPQSTGTSSDMSPSPSSSGFPTTTDSPASTVIPDSTTASSPEPSSLGSGSSTAQESPSGVTSSTPYDGPPSSSEAPSTSESGTAYPAPTTTGTPNCFDRSPFDGSVNDNYLILCDTDLPGYDLDVVPASDIAECIDACRSYVPTSQGQCVAVEFDILESGNSCHLKYGIASVNRGANSFSQAAIVVNEPYAPEIVFSGTESSSTPSSSTAESSATIGPPPPVSTMSTTPSMTTPPSSPSTQQNTPSSGSGGVQSSQPAMSSTTVGSPSSGGQQQSSTTSTSGSSAISSRTPTPSTVTATSSRTTAGLSSTTTARLCAATPTTTNLCPTYNHQGLNVNSDGYCYEVECATALQGTILAGNSSTETSLKNCIGLCTNYNVALPFGCVGVSYLGSSSGLESNCILMSAITGTVANANVQSGRLIYAGYPAINDPVYPLPSSTTDQIAATSTISPSGVPASSGTTSATVTTSYVPTTCPAAPTDASTICPGNSPVCYQYDYLGNSANYELECSTQFTGSTSQPLLTFDLNDCINQCQYANVLRANSCLGVTFVVNPVGQGSTNNCYPFSSITCGTRGNATFNSARLLYAGYPRITDYTDSSFLCGSSAASSSFTESLEPRVTSSSGTSRLSTTTSRAQTTATTSASPVNDLSQATSSNFPLAFPQDPVCDNNLRSKYYGGQLRINAAQGRIYDIECASDYTNPGNNPFGATTQPTYNSCANQCDLAAGQSSTCAAFSWTASSGLCTLFGRVSNGVQLTTNMTQTNGVHSGRWLTPIGSPTTSQPLQLYLARPVPFQVGPRSAGSQSARDYPGGTNTYYNGWSDTNHATLLDLSTVLPGFTWTIFGQSTTTLWVTANFWFTNTNLAVTSSTQNTWSTLSRNSDSSPLSFPAGNLPGYTLAPFWSYGHIIGASQQGIYYQIDLISTDRYGISIEWFFSHYGQDNNVFHAITTYDTGHPGVWSTYFFTAGASSGATRDQGQRQTVGGQGDPSIASQYFTFCAGVQDCVVPGAKMTMDTTQLNNMGAVMNYTAALFNPTTYQVGTWTWSTKP
ncbi:hypothetical protein PV04_05318 [Phialophora macrospora]|uniref:DUF7908 domain-containing protein n=1 Tax=Phialophora macrospora TaxID=1851006 RepID=A0A0D2CWB0_9EURO|nr:hypothetical protein PV04_05318 [Phialophora macrospora]